MSEAPFQLTYLPLFYDDLREATDYISFTLQNPDAARRLIDLTEQAILKRLDNPLSFQPVSTKKERKYNYYRITVRNFSVYYVVIGNVMEVRRFLYNKRNIRDIL